MTPGDVLATFTLARPARWTIRALIIVFCIPLGIASVYLIRMSLELTLGQDEPLPVGTVSLAALVGLPWMSLIIGIVTAVLGWRASLGSTTVTTAGIRVRSVLRSSWIPWEDVAEIVRHPRTGTTSIRTADGRVRTAAAIPARGTWRRFEETPSSAGSASWPGASVRDAHERFLRGELAASQ